GIRDDLVTGVQTCALPILKGKGGVGRAGAAAGDLYFIVKVRPHPLLRRDGKDLTIEVPITIGEAIRGATIAVPTPDGTVRLKVRSEERRVGKECRARSTAS